MAETERRLQYLPALDGVRAVAVAMVLGIHLFPDGPLDGGFLGVDVFFVLSGFLITRLIADEVDRTDGFRAGAFLQRRVARLAPAVLTLLAAVTVSAMYVASDPTTLRAVAPTALYVSNFWSAAGREMGSLAHLWTLAMEEQFYLLWAFIAPLVLRLRRPDLALTLAVVGFSLWRAALMISGTDGVYWRFDTRVDGLLVGCVLALVLRRRAWRPQPWLIGAAWAGLVVLNFAPVSPFWLLIPTINAVAVVIVADAAQSERRWLQASAVRWVGVRSYGIYLWHYPIYVLVDRFTPHTPATSVLLVLPVTLIVAAVSYTFVEVPLRARLQPAERLGVSEQPQERDGQVRIAV